MKKVNFTTVILWIVFFSLLAVLLPHTAWAFRAFEPTQAEHLTVIFGGFTSADLVSWVAAIAFEASIAALVHKLAKHIEQVQKEVKRLSGWWAKFSRQYVNAYSLGLVAATSVSSLANLAHAVEFASELAIFAEWGIPSEVYVIVFGGVLPFVSLLFARVLSQVNEEEGQEDPIIVELKQVIAGLRSSLKSAEAQVKQAEAAKLAAEQSAREALQKFEHASEFMAALFAEDKRQRILAARQQWPQLSGNAIAQITGSAPSYVSEVLNAVVIEEDANV